MVENLAVSVVTPSFQQGLLALVGRGIPLFCLAVSEGLAAGAGGTSSTVTASSPVQHAVVFENGKEGYPHYRIPSVVVTKTGDILAFAEGRGLQKGTHGDITGNHLVMKRSRDNGQTWSALKVIRSEPGNSLLGPCTVVTETGRIILIYHRYLPGTTEGNAGEGYEGNRVVGVFVTVSDDNGGRWSDARDITRQVKAPIRWTGILTGPGIAIQKTRAPHKGRIVVPCAHGPSGRWQCYTFHSDDNGETWQLGGEVPDQLGNECQVVELSDGRLLLNMRSFRRKGCRAYSTSEDAGATWSKMVDVPALPEPVCQGSTLRYPVAAKGQLNPILFSNPDSTQKRANGTVRMSLDDGATWPIGKVLSLKYFGYSCLTVLPDGRVGCLYETDDLHRIVFDVFGLDWLKSKD
jgi:sialidase-1